MASSASNEEWPRGFRMAPLTSARAKFWSHELYRGTHAQPVRILYSRTKMQSEEIAHEFLGESVLGFDMEWPWHNPDQADVPLQQRIGLIQLASEDKIALFHIGLHAGQTSKDVLAPALRQIIESEKITKTGVGILNADFSRIHKWFGLEPRGAFELGHLHNLVTYGARHPIKVTTRMRSLSKLVDEHLGLPLYKGKVRTSNWSRPLNKAQILYAAADAYAGLMLYHCMNAKRLNMDPTPPLPLHAETYLPMRQGMGSIIPVQLGSSSHGKSGISTVEFYHQLMTEKARPVHAEVTLYVKDEEDSDVEGEDEEEQEEEKLGDITTLPPDGQATSPALTAGPVTFKEQLVSRTNEGMELVVVGRLGKQILLEQREIGVSTKAPEPRALEPPRQKHSRDASASSKDPDSGHVLRPTLIDPETPKVLFERLCAHRKSTAKERKCPAFVVAHNTLLSAISEKQPRNGQELRQIQGIGKVKAELYGPAWLAIVHNFLEEQTAVATSDKKEMASTATLSTTPTSRRTQTDISVNEIYSSHRKTPAVLHTGLSFKMENATLEAGTDQTSIEISDDSSAFGSPLRSPSPSTLKRKRELYDSPSHNQIKQRPVLPKPALHPRRPVANAVQQPDLQATISLTQSATEAKKTTSPQSEAMHTSPARPHHAAPKQIFSPQFVSPGAAPKPRTQASMEAYILRNKLLAFNRRVTSAFILSEDTIEYIIQRPPNTAQELLQIPNILPFANACARQNQCLLTFILKSTQKPALSVS